MLYSEKLKAFAAAHPCEHITVDGVQYRYLLRGKESARTLVFLNGGMNTLEMWMDYVDGLSGDCRVLPFDHPQIPACKGNRFVSAYHLEARKMKTEARKMLVRWYILGAIGGILMAAGDWLLGCIPIEGTDTGMFHRAYYLSGAYGLWRPVLIVGMGAIGTFLYYFMVKALNAGIDETCRKTRSVQYLCGIFTVAVALAIHLWSATLAWFTTYLGPRIGAEAAIAAVTAYPGDKLVALLVDVCDEPEQHKHCHRSLVCRGGGL